MNQSKFKKVFYSQKVAPFVFIFPFILSFCFFWIYPLFSTIKMSFQNVSLGGTEWVMFDNYKKLLSDKVFHIAVQNSTIYMVWTIVLLIPIPMLYAVLMDSDIVKAKGVWKAFLYLPALTSVVVSGTLFRMMFSEADTSQINIIMNLLGKSPIRWLKGKETGMAAMVILACWKWTGVNMLYFLAGLKNIPHALYEAADVDGASSWKKFIHITMPLLKPTTVYVITISVYAGLSMFLESYMLWNGNNSPKNIGLTIVGYLYRRGIEKSQLGYASAVGLVLLIIALIINLIQLIFNSTFKKEED